MRGWLRWGGSQGPIPAVIGVLPISRFEVIDRGVDGLIFVPHLVSVASTNQGVVDLRVEDVRILVLRIAALIAELREAGNTLHVEAADHGRIGRQARDAGHQTRKAPAVRALTAVGARKGKARIQNRVLVERVSATAGNLLVEDVDIAVAVAPGRPLNVRRRSDLALVLAVANESCRARTERFIEDNAALVIDERV